MPAPQRLLLLVLLAACLCSAEIIDRIAVSVGNRVITTVDLEREIRVTSFLNGTALDFSKASKEATANRLIEQKLIRLELENARYQTPDPSEVQPVLAKFKQDHYKSDDEFRAALTKYGLTEQDILDELLWQRSLLLFLNQRFRPAVEVTDQEIAEYFEKQVAPAARISTPEKTPALEDFRDRIEEILTGKRVDEQVNKWLEEARRRTGIRHHLEAFQ